MKNNPFEDNAKTITIMTQLGVRIYNPEIFDYLHDLLILPNNKKFIERFIELNNQKKLSHFLSLVGFHGQIITTHQTIDAQLLANVLKNYAQTVDKILTSFNKVLAPEFHNGILPAQKDKLHELYKLYIGVVCSQSMIHFCVANLYIELAQQQDVNMVQTLNKQIEFLTESRKQIFIAVDIMVKLFPQKSFLIHEEDKCSFVLSLIFACLPLLLSSASKITAAMASSNAPSKDQFTQQEKLKNDELLKTLNEMINKCYFNLEFKESAQKINFIIDNHIHFIDKIVDYDAKLLSQNIDYAVSLLHKNMTNKTIVNVKSAHQWAERLLRIFSVHYTNISVSDIKKVYALKLADDVQSAQFTLNELNIFYKTTHQLLLQTQKLEKRLRLVLEVVHYVLRSSVDITVWPDINVSDKAIAELSRLLINLDLISQRLLNFVSFYNAILTLISYRHSVKANAELDQWVYQEKTEKQRPLLTRQTTEKICSQNDNSADYDERANSNILEVKKGVASQYWQQLSQVAKEINAFKKISIQYKETELDLYEKWCYFFVEDNASNNKSMLTDVYVDQLNLILDKCNALLTVARLENDNEFEANVIVQLAEAYMCFAEKLFAIFYLNPTVHNHLTNKCTYISHMPLLYYLLPEVYSEYFMIMIKSVNYLLSANAKYNKLVKNSHTIFNELKDHAYLCISSNLTYLMSIINDILTEAERQINCFEQCKVPQDRMLLQTELRELSILSVSYYIYIIEMLECLKTITVKECHDIAAEDDYQQIYSFLHEKLINLKEINAKIDTVINMADNYIKRINKIDISVMQQQWLFKRPTIESSVISNAMDSPRQMNMLKS